MAGEQKVRVVRCPRCENLLPEPSDLSVYQCGGCGAVLRAKSIVPLHEKNEYLGGASDSSSMEPNIKERVFPMQRVGVKDIGLVQETRNHFAEQRTENWVRGYNLEQEVNIYDSGAPSTAPYANPIGTFRSRADFEHQRVERDAFTGYPGNSVAVADRKGVRNICYPSDTPSSSNLDIVYGQPEPIRNYERPRDGLDPSRAELLRKLDELKDQIIKSCDVGNKPRVADRGPVDPYYDRATNNVPMQSSTKSSQEIHDPHYLNRRNGTFPATGLHQRNSEEFLRPSRHVVKDMPFYEDQFRDKMKRKTNYPPNHQYPPQLPREPYPESFVDFVQDLLPPPLSEEAFFHHPACSCTQCSKRNQQGLLQASNSPSNISNSHKTMESGTYPNTVGHKVRFPSQDTLPHSRQPSELDSVIDGFGLVQPRKASILQQNGKSFDAIAGGAPFIVCISCLELLKLPRKLYKLEMAWHKLQCGACSVIFIVKVENRRLVVSVLPETKPKEFSPDDGSPPIVVNAANSLERSDSSSHKLLGTDHNNNRDSNLGESKRQELTLSHMSSQEKEIPAIKCEPKSLSQSSDLPSQNAPSSTNSKENYDNPSFHEPNKYREESENKQNTVIDDVTEPSELHFSIEDYSNIRVSQDSVETSKEVEEEDQSKNKSSRIRDISRTSESPDDKKLTVSVNGQPLPAHAVKKAEKQAGPILPGDYWYDYLAGFWGVMGQPCLGIIPAFIDEFTYPMSRNCGAGNTGIFVNGRELHKRDLELLSSRGLPTTTNKFYKIDMFGRVVDENSGKELHNLGKLAPNIEKAKRGFGMKVPRTLK